VFRRSALFVQGEQGAGGRRSSAPTRRTRGVHLGAPSSVGEPSGRGHVLTLLRADLAPPPRTLVDILQSTTEAHPDAAAIDNGAEVLTYTELMERAGELATLLGEVGAGKGSRVGVRIRSGTTELYVAIAAVLLAGAAYVPVDADDPDERAATVFGEA